MGGGGSDIVDVSRWIDGSMDGHVVGWMDG